MSWRSGLLAAAMMGVATMSQEAGAVPAGEEHVPPDLVLSTCEDPAAWAGGVLDQETFKSGIGAIRWAHALSPGLTLRDVPADWSAYNTLAFDLYSETATQSRFLVYIGSENPDSEGADYYSANVTLNFTGWRTLHIPFAPMGKGVRSPLGWEHITSLRFTASGWGNSPHPDAVVVVDNLRLTWTPPETGPRLDDTNFFAALDLERPGLETVKSAVANGDFHAAKGAFADYLRQRREPRWFFDWRQRPRFSERPDGVNTEAADKIVAHLLTSCGIPHQFGEDIDWSINPTKLQYKEWTWQLSRHPFWKTLGRAYWDTGDETYAREFVYQMTDWVTDNPVPLNSSGNSAGSRWRTIETGIRMLSSWPDSFFRFLSSPSFTDDALILMVKSMVEHARHLASHPTRNNWLAMEMNGLFHVAVLFPECRDAETWRQMAVTRLYAEMEQQVYPDGAQIELSTGYHGVSLNNFLGTFRLAQLNDINLPDDYVQRLEKMYDYYLKLMMPDGLLPALNDSGWGSVQRNITQAAELFPERDDFAFIAAGRSRGNPPEMTSVWFPYAGWAVMRSGWGSEDLYLLFEVGPFGAGHQHEDKLSLVLHAYGRRLLTEGGVYAYDSSPWRRYVLSARAHNLTMVDGLEQCRRGLAETYVITEPLPNRWFSNQCFDFAEGWFTEGYGKERNRAVTHYRSVLFVKARQYWLVLDRFVPTDSQSHQYDMVFHFNTDQSLVQEQPLAALSAAADQANLAIVPLQSAGMSLQVVCGQEEPEVQGWVPAGGYAMRPVATPVFSLKQAGTVIVPWLLFPLQAKQEFPLRTVRAAESDGSRTYTMVFTDGQEDELQVPVAAFSEGTASGTGALHWTSRRDGQITGEVGVPEG